MADTKLIGDGTADKFICTLFVEGVSVKVRVQKIDFTTCVLNWGYTAALGSDVNFSPATDGETVLYDAVIAATRGQTIYYNITVDSVEQFAAARTFRIPRDEQSFRMVCAFDLHLYGVNVSGVEVTGNADLLATMQANFAVPLVGINALNPDYVFIGGDETESQWGIGSGDDETDVVSMHSALLTTLQAVLKPIYSVPGNHENDNGAYTIFGGAETANATRAKYLMHPSNGVAARYGYVDIGPARLIFLNPLAYTTEVYDFTDTTPAKAFSLGTAQRNFLAAALEGPQKFNLIFIHHMLTGRPQLNADTGAVTGRSYGWGGLGLHLSPATYTYDDEMLPLLRGKRVSVFQGHSQVYCREQVPETNGVVLYTAPAAGGKPMTDAVAPSGNTRLTSEYFGFKEQSPEHYWEYENSAGEGGLLCIDVHPSRITVTVCKMDGTPVSGGGLINPTTVDHKDELTGKGWMR